MKIAVLLANTLGGQRVKKRTGELTEALKEGETVRAEVMSSGKGRATLKTEDGQIIKARLEPGVSLAVNGEVMLEVKSKEEGVTYLAIMEQGGEESSGRDQKPGERQLEDKTLEPYARKLAELSIPVREETARGMRELMAQYPEITMDEAAFLVSNKIEGGEEVMAVVREVVSGEVKVEDIAAELMKLAGEAGETDEQRGEITEKPSVNGGQAKMKGEAVKVALTDILRGLIDVEGQGKKTNENKDGKIITQNDTIMQNEISIEAGINKENSQKTVKRREKQEGESGEGSRWQQGKQANEGKIGDRKAVITEGMINGREERGLRKEGVRLEQGIKDQTIDKAANRAERVLGSEPQSAEAVVKTERQAVDKLAERVLGSEPRSAEAVVKTERQAVDKPAERMLGSEPQSTEPTPKLERQVDAKAVNHEFIREPQDLESTKWFNRQPETNSVINGRSREQGTSGAFLSQNQLHMEMAVNRSGDREQQVSEPSVELYRQTEEKNAVQISGTGRRTAVPSTENNPHMPERASTYTDRQIIDQEAKPDSHYEEQKETYDTRKAQNHRNTSFVQSQSSYRSELKQELPQRLHLSQNHSGLEPPLRSTTARMLSPQTSRNFDETNNSQKLQTENALKSKAAPDTTQENNQEMIEKTEQALVRVLAEIPELKGTPEPALTKFSKLLLNAAQDTEDLNGNMTKKLTDMLDKVFYKVQKDDEKAGERLRQVKDELYIRLSLIEEAASNAPQPVKTELLTQTKKLMDQVKIFNSIEQFVYFQLPVKMGDDYKTADLYVYKRKRNTKSGEVDNVNILLSLDLENMGHWESFIKIKGKDVSLSMEVEGEQVKEFISENTVMLHTLLAESGFKLSATDISYSMVKTTPLTALSTLERHKTGRTSGINFTV